MDLKHELWAALAVLALLASCSGNNGQQRPPAQEEKPQRRLAKPDTTEKEAPRVQWPVIEDEEKYLREYAEEHPENKVRLHTRFGDMVLRLYDDTPLHRANFIHHIRYGLYENTIFYRVEKGFVVQGGNSDHPETQELRSHIKPYYIPSEVRPHHIHKRGAVAMAMTEANNPEHESAQYSFYIVTGKVFTPAMLKATELEYGTDIPEAHEKVYTTAGGAPHLDGTFTVFGEVVEGFDVLEKIENTKVDSGHWPVEDVVISCEIIE